MRAIECPIAADDLRRMYLDGKLTDEQIADAIGQGATVKRVRSWRRRFGIETILRLDRYDVLPIEGRLRSLLVGSMLGDGGLVRTPNGARYHENHCDAQREYLQWKVAQWGAWVDMEPKPVVWRDKKQSTEYAGWRFNTLAHSSLIPWHTHFYDGTRGKKRLSREVVDYIDDFALAIWFMDDGSTGWWPRITFGMDTVSRYLAIAMLNRLGFEPRWEVHRGNTGDFIFDNERQAERFIAMVTPHMPDCMARKLTFGFQGPHYQVRQALTPELLSEMAARGIPMKRIARETGQSEGSVRRYLEQFHIDHPRRGKPGRPRTT